MHNAEYGKLQHQVKIMKKRNALIGIAIAGFLAVVGTCVRYLGSDNGDAIEQGTKKDTPSVMKKNGRDNGKPAKSQRHNAISHNGESRLDTASEPPITEEEAENLRVHAVDFAGNTIRQIIGVAEQASGESCAPSDGYAIPDSYEKEVTDAGGNVQKLTCLKAIGKDEALYRFGDVAGLDRQQQIQTMYEKMLAMAAAPTTPETARLSLTRGAMALSEGAFMIGQLPYAQEKVPVLNPNKTEVYAERCIRLWQDIAAQEERLCKYWRAIVLTQTLSGNPNVKTQNKLDDIEGLDLPDIAATTAEGWQAFLNERRKDTVEDCPETAMPPRLPCEVYKSWAR